MKESTTVAQEEDRKLCKTIIIKIPGLREYNEILVGNAIEYKKGHKIARRALIIDKKQIVAE